MPRDHAEPPERDDFVAAIVEDPNAPPDTVLLSGFVGDSPEPNHARLYLDPELRSYVDIPNDAILFSKPVPEERSALGGSFLWIKRDAELLYHKSTRLKARFLEGRIAAAYGGDDATRERRSFGNIEPVVSDLVACPIHVGGPPPAVTVGVCGGQTFGCMYIGKTAGCILEGDLGGDFRRG